MKVVLVTGGFDPVHNGHMKYFRAAKALGNLLVVGVNSDSWLERKKGRAFMPHEERVAILSNVRHIDGFVSFDDSDDTAIDAIRKVKQLYGHFPDLEIIFANGGDRTNDNIPEMSETGVTFEFGVGGEDKSNSSSWILDEWKAPKTERPWGYYRILHNPDPTLKVKELTVNPGQRLSMQRHQNRSEFWFVAEGTATVKWDEHGKTITKVHQSETIQNDEWHQLINNSDTPLKIVEIQYGTDCNESDIERR
jgi:cytidyltransferase-like protein